MFAIRAAVAPAKVALPEVHDVAHQCPNGTRKGGRQQHYYSRWAPTFEERVQSKEVGCDGATDHGGGEGQEFDNNRAERSKAMIVSHGGDRREVVEVELTRGRRGRYWTSPLEHLGEDDSSPSGSHRQRHFAAKT